MRNSVWVFGVLVLGLLSGCGVGVGQMLTRGTVGPDEGTTFSNTSSGGVSDTSMGLTRANAITVYDSTGMLIAALGTAGNQYNARRDAEESARRRGAQAGDTFDYSYDVVQPAAGTNTRMTLAWGSTENVSISGPLGEGERSGGDVSYFLFDVRATFAGFDLQGGGRWDFNLGAIWESWDGTVVANTNAGAVTHEVDATWIGMPFGTTVTYPLIGPLSATGGIAIDPLMALLCGLLSEGGNWLFLEGTARLDFRPFPWLLVWSGLTQRFQPWELGDRAGEVTAFDIGVAFMYQPQ